MRMEGHGMRFYGLPVLTREAVCEDFKGLGECEVLAQGRQKKAKVNETVRRA